MRNTPARIAKIDMRGLQILKRSIEGLYCAVHSCHFSTLSHPGIFYCRFGFILAEKQKRLILMKLAG